MNDQALKDYFFFNDVDLNFNKNGKFSKKQLNKLTQDDNVASRFIGVMGLTLTFLALIYPSNIIIRTALATQQGANSSTQWNIGWIIVTFLIGAIGCYCLYTGFFDKTHSPAKFQVQKTEGLVHFVAMDSGKNTEVVYSLRIGKTKMEVVDHNLMEIMKEGDRYAAYLYNPNDGTGNYVLSVEYLSKK